jgi:hypothetical protein
METLRLAGLVVMLLGALAAAESVPGAVILRGGERIAYVDAGSALAAAQAGDEVLLAAGVHRGPLVLDRSRLILRGELGAVVDGTRTDWLPLWTPEPACGPHAWASPISFRPDVVTMDGRMMIDVREGRGGLAVHAMGVGRVGRSVLGAIFTYLPGQEKNEAGRLIISFAGPDDPARHRIAASPKDTAVVAIRGADDCIVEGLIITGGRSGVRLEATQGSVVRRCLVMGCDYGIHLGKGAAACRILGNDVTLHADAMNGNCDPDTGKAGDDVWHAHKDFGTYDKIAIYADNAGRGNEVAGNYLYDVWDGIATNNDIPDLNAHLAHLAAGGTVDANRDLWVHHNRVDLAMDDALSPCASLMGNRWHSNIITRAGCAVRFKSIDLGPFHFFDNVLIDNSDGLRIYRSAPPSAVVVIHNNLIIHPGGVVYLKVDARGTPAYRVYNNLFVAERPFSCGGGDAVPPSYVADCNLYTCKRGDLPTQQERDHNSLFATMPQFVDPTTGNWHLVPGSPGTAVGLPFASFPVATALPEGWIAPAKPDIGLLHIAPELVPHRPVSGLWEAADAAYGLRERRPEDTITGSERWQQLGSGGFLVAPPVGGTISSITVLRAADRGKKQWKVEAVAGDGAVLASASGGPPGMRAITLPLSTAQSGIIEVRIDDQDSARWRVDTAGGGSRVGLRTGKQVGLCKFDGGAWVFTVDVPTAGDGLAYTFERDFDAAFGLALVDADGVRSELPTSGRLAPGTVGQLHLTFTKRADFTAGTGDQVLWLAQDQPRVVQRSRWPRPIY